MFPKDICYHRKVGNNTIIGDSGDRNFICGFGDADNAVGVLLDPTERQNVVINGVNYEFYNRSSNSQNAILYSTNPVTGEVSFASRNATIYGQEDIAHNVNLYGMSLYFYGGNLDDTISDVGNLFITNTHTKKLEDTYLLLDSYNKNTAFVNTMMFLYTTMVELIVVYKANIDINDYVAIITDVDVDDNDEEKSIKYVGLNYKVFELFEKILKNNKENKEEIDFVINLGKSFYNKAVEAI